MSPIDASALANLMDDLTAIVIVTISIIGGVWLISQIIKAKAGKKLAPAEAAMLEQLNRIAERMEGRMSAVERILDADAPSWRRDAPVPGASTNERFG